MKHFEGLFDGFISVADDKFSTHEHRILVIDLLVSHVQLLKAVTVLLEHLSNVFVDDLIGDFFVLT